MTSILQPYGSNLCGQTCVAMLADISLEESIAVFGKRSATSTKDVVQALRTLGIECGDKMVRETKHTVRPGLCLCVMHFADTWRTHWTIWNGGVFYDPAIGIVTEYPEYARITSHLPIFKKSKEER